MTTDVRLPHWLYRIYGAKDELLYIGITINLCRRLRAHRSSRDWYQPDMICVKARVFSDYFSAADAEVESIRLLQPRFNRAHKIEAQWKIQRRLKAVS